MVNINTLTSSNYLKASDLRGQNREVEIIEEKIETVGSGVDAKQKLVIYFRGAQKGLVLNQTNSLTIAELLNSQESSDWVGGKITLTTKIAEFGGKRNPAIRVMDKWDIKNNHQPVDAGMYNGNAQQQQPQQQAQQNQFQPSPQQNQQPPQQEQPSWEQDLNDDIPF